MGTGGKAVPSIATGKSEGSCLVEWQADSAAQLCGVCQQGGDQTHLEAVCKPEAQAALACGLRVVQMCDDLTEQQGDDGGKHVVDGQGAKGQRRHIACRQATAAGRGERCEQGNKLRLECPRAWRLGAASTLEEPQSRTYLSLLASRAGLFQIRAN